MSLYGGISFGDTPISAELTKLEASTSTTNASPTPPLNSSSTTSTSTEVDSKVKPATTWSTALKFAPHIRKKVQASSQSNNSIPLSLQSAFNNSEVSSNIPGISNVIGVSKSALSTPTIIAAPSLYSSIPSASTSNLNAVPIRTGRILQAPSMTLDDEDVNGFRQTTKGKRSAGKQGKSGNKKKKGGMREDPQLGFSDVLYEPSKPCDYSAYKAHLQAQRTQRRLDREEERRREQSPSGSSYYGSSGEDKSGDEQKSSKKARLFAPPTSYDSPPPSDDLPMLTPATYTSAIISQPNLQAAPRAETGEEAYLRRVALSAGGPPKLPPPPPQPQPSYPTFTAATTSSGPSLSYTPPVSTFNSQQAPPPPPPTFVPPTFGPVQPGDTSFPPFRPPPSSATSLDGISINVSAIPLSDAAARARDIAQRLGKLAGMQPSIISPPIPAVPSDPDNRPFAERLMSKFGWKEGQGLGAEESGMTSALSVSKANSTPHSSSKKGKELAASGPIPITTGMGTRIIDSTRSDRNAKQTAEIGEPSRVVLLTNLCGRNDVDDDLGGEVAEEASKFGVVERCFVYLVPGEIRDDESVRIFLVMSGLAGGYNAVRNFGGRFFGGRVVKARFYDERTFNSGQHLN